MTTADFGAIRHQILALHRGLVEIERQDYERANGRLSPAEFLHHLLHDATFAWLKPLTALIAQMDEADEIDDRAQAEEAKAAVLVELRALLRSGSGVDGGGARANGDFQDRYQALLQQEPGLVVEHGKLVQAISR